MRDAAQSDWTLASLLQQVEVAFRLRRFADVVRLAEEGLALGFRDAQLFDRAAACAAEMGQFDKAEAYFQQALALNPNRVGAAFGLGLLYGERNRMDEAERYYRYAVTRDPNYAEALCNLGNLYCEQGRLREAEACYLRTLELHPEWVSLKNNLSFVLLAQERFAEGWALREARYDPRLQKRNSETPKLPFPQWRGEPLSGKSIVLWDEQGFGDVIQFARYARMLRERGASKITIVCRKPLKALLETLAAVDRVAAFDSGDTLEYHDCWSFVLSLPLYHGTTLANIPADAGYLSAPPASRMKWREAIPQTGFRVGLVWKGSTEHMKDRDRSLETLELLRPLWRVPGVTFVSLQKGQGEAEAAAPPDGMPLIHLGADIQDFADAAALVEQLDLVISVDTAIVHLAGALGKPVWALLPHLADWRWLIGREDSPWYPSVRLFRQHKRLDWDGVIERVRSELAVLAAQSCAQAEAKDMPT